MNFTDGTRLDLRGSAPADKVLAVTDFYEKLRKWETHGVGEPVQRLFNDIAGEGPRTSLNPGGQVVTWSFELEIKQNSKQ